jgi:putative solute:sodium symporter small subunit
MAEFNQEKRTAYWRENVRLMVILLSVWFVISYLCGIVFVEELNTIRLGGYKLGFWFAQQGSMYGFVAIIFIYARRMTALDRKYDLHEK